ncbi:hypothetical protein SADUNF_Sadunf11G0094000 [Salix dunnii]|uniref:Apple domain-containing protein n=1 Tax=Salix dunnii TaxID=1413687 RepID=A0A835JL07_9ROSI|nr:hypothetical protein SADUNF_Sadunf11G0094000 [Salix dunnii]
MGMLLLLTCISTNVLILLLKFSNALESISPSESMSDGKTLIGWDQKTGIDRRLSSWKSPDDPSPGDFTWTLERQSNPEGVTWNGSKKYYRSGPWNGIGFSGAPEIKAGALFYFNFISNDQEVSYSYEFKDRSVITREVLNQTTYHRQRYTWSEDTQSWILYGSVPRDLCDNYGRCGVNGNCIASAVPICQCLEKFKPKSQKEWNTMDWSQGCVRNKELECQKGDGFMKLDGLKLPDATDSWVDKTMNLKECRANCLRNCSCMAYTNLDIRGRGSGCAIWFGDLLDIRQVSIGGQTLYVRLHASEIEAKAKPKIRIAVITPAAIAVILGMLMAICYLRKRKAKRTERMENYLQTGHENDNGQKEDLELPLFELSAIANATNNFSISNKLGEGGYGPVYKTWRLWNEGKTLDLTDDLRDESCNPSEVLRCIHISLLCVQQHPDDRPNMASVVWMLSGESALPKPKEPTFLNVRGPPESSSSSYKAGLSSTNDITFSVLEPR